MAFEFFLLLLLAAPASAQGPSSCPVEGERIHWIADVCMSQLETDDEIAAMECIIEELERPFPDDCAARAHYKRTLCQQSLANGSVVGAVERCFQDKEFMGSTVRNGGVGN
ncbi:MAG: hypothetical protein IH614_09420 [Desulfuromonadales bacterium]|nr:hypothetical protein [Desulfuromonadales bacterium]